MKKFSKVVTILGVLALSPIVVPQGISAAVLTADQQSFITAEIAKGSSPAVILKATADVAPPLGPMDCAVVVKFLSEKADKDQTKLSEIVYAAVSSGCDPGQVTDAALKAGANLKTVMGAAKRAGADMTEVKKAAGDNNFTAVDIANATPPPSDAGGPTVGGPISLNPVVNPSGTPHGAPAPSAQKPGSPVIP